MEKQTCAIAAVVLVLLVSSVAVAAPVEEDESMAASLIAGLDQLTAGLCGTLCPAFEGDLRAECDAKCKTGDFKPKESDITPTIGCKVYCNMFGQENDKCVPDCVAEASKESAKSP